ncbi:MAG: ribosomal protein L11 methyltransferase [Gammaproteobacteria bacterium SG8_11]|nr:MAG: ribosomal protein L11 methyltransferase [Gammaproteobacteria bacterium SG8_11]
MPWLQLSLKSTERNAETLSDLLTELGAASVTLRDAADQPLYEPPPGATPLWNNIEVIALFDADQAVDPIIQALGDALAPAPVPEWKLEPLEDKDWQNEWIKHFQPMQFGRRLWICPSWTSPPDSEAVNILLDPGLAFGTGTHPTTALCLQWLDENISGGETLVDFGCGSGILALAAAKLGASQVWAVDNDPQALLACRANAEKNQLTQHISLCAPEELNLASVDIIIANILANPLLQLAPRFAELLKPGGHLVLSGILGNQVEMIDTRYREWFRLERPVQQDDWVRLDGVKK